MILTDGIHLMTDMDDLVELHAFARTLNLKPEWFQAGPLHPHYDLTTRRARRRAIDAGATLVTPEELVRRCSRLFKDSPAADVAKGPRTRTCPECSASCRPTGKPRPQLSGYVDQLVLCPKCGWVGVLSEIPVGPVQLTLGLGE